MIRKRGKAYQVIVPGFSARTVYTREAATKLELDLKNRKALGHLYEAKPNTLGEELTGYDQRKDATGTYRAATKDEHEQLRKSWRPLRGMLVNSLTRQIVEDAFTLRAKKAPIMADKELRYLKAALREAASRGQRIDPAIFEIKPTNKKPRRATALTVAQLYGLENWLPEYIKRIVPVAGMVGARQLFWFRVTDDLIDLKAGTMIAPAELMKNDKEMRIPLTSTEVALLREQLVARPGGTSLVFPTQTGKVWSRHNFRKQVWDGAVKAAGLDGFTFHMLRHTAGSLMAHSGMDPAVAALRLGHTDGGALFLRTYRHLYSDELRRQADRFDAYLKAETERAFRDNARTSGEA